MGNEIQTRSNGFDLQPRDMGEAMRLATMIANSQLAPKSFMGKPEDTLVAMMMGNELGLNPLQSIQNIAVVNGRPCVWGDAMLALVQNHPAFGGIEETFDEATMAAICTVWRKKGTKHTQVFSQKDAEVAGLWGRNTWKQYPKRMLAMRARGFALRNQFADALLGLITAEEAQDIPLNESIAQSESNVAQISHNAPLPFYPQQKFEENIGAWTDAVKTQKITPEAILGKLKSGYQLTDEQEAIITDLENAA
jgi:hypothetical protein